MQKPRSSMGVPLRTLQKNCVLVSNAASLYVTTIIDSALGLGFWTVAARTFTLHQVGYGSAAISAMIILSTTGVFGPNIICELPRRKSRGGPISTAILTAATGSFILAVDFVFIAPLISSNLAFISDHTLQFVVFVSGLLAAFLFEAVITTPQVLCATTTGRHRHRTGRGQELITGQPWQVNFGEEKRHWIN